MELVQMMELKVKKLHEDSIVPKYAHVDDAGMDLHSYISFELRPGKAVSIPTGIAVSLERGYEAQIRGRSGLAFKYSIWAFNGTIDAGYTGEISILIENKGEDTFVINKGDRIAQMVFNKVQKTYIDIVTELAGTERGEGGFGSTGM